jgi:glutathione peroxidase
MKIIIGIALIAAALALYAFKKNQGTVKAKLVSTTPSNIYDITYSSITGETVSMSSYKGKYVLIVNVASKCGFTPQYEKLESLYKTYGDKLVIVGFPCNQFLGQEPGSEQEIAEFCTKNYGVTFPLASKINVKGKDQHPLYTWLTSKALNQVEDSEVKWNFHKYLIGPDGAYLGGFGSRVDPLDASITGLIR